MSDRPDTADPRRSRLIEVRDVESLTPSLIRIAFAGDLDGFAAGAFTDHYVKLTFPAPGAGYQPPYDADQLRATLPREQWPRTRSYTVGDWDPDAGRLTIDFVVHGDSGVAGPWAARARPGDLLQMRGPGGAYAPDPDADWYLMVGDLSALPAIAVSLARIPPQRPVRAVIQVDAAAEQVALDSPGRLELSWIHGHDEAGLVQALEAIDWPAGHVHAFVHGEAGSVRRLRRHLLAERGLSPEQLSISGYWKSTRTDEEWRQEKREWNRQVESDLETTGQR
jgi:NADPH-dependent ferric siderophore reductase